ncbi:MAG: hypothetical protein ABJB11_15335 [Ferruginibacter sp.]
MKQFMLKIICFLSPVIALQFYAYFFYSYSENPDLLRIGFIPSFYKGFKKNLKEEYIKDIYFTNLSKTKKRKFKILTIGDSFSEQKNYGYKNYLAEKFDVLHVDRFISQNQIQTLCGMLNSDFFDTYQIDYVVLENVERSFVENIKYIDTSAILSFKQIDSIVKNYKSKSQNYQLNLYSNSALKLLYTSIQSLVESDFLANDEVYNAKINTTDLFSNNTNNLLFYHDDLKSVVVNNERGNVLKLNNLLNGICEKLRRKKIKLIVLPAPDKYDLYYDFIINKSKFSKPFFFENLEPLQKDYIYINAKSVLSKSINKFKDVYFYDDSHWSPIASKILAAEIEKQVKISD